MSEPMFKFTQNKPSQIKVQFVPSNMPYTRWNRFKTAIWNFILPPHVRLYLPKEEEEL